MSFRLPYRLGAIRASLVVALAASILANAFLLLRTRSSVGQARPGGADVRSWNSPIPAPCLPSEPEAAESSGAKHDDPQDATTSEMDAFARFERERRDDAWASDRESYLRPRVEKLARLNAVTSFDVECRTACCMIRFQPNEQLFLDLQSSAGVPMLGNSMAGDDFVATCYERDVPFPAIEFTDRLEERTKQAGTIARAQAECGHVADEPGSVTVRVIIEPKGDFTLRSDGGLLGTSAVACVEDFLYRELQFRPASAVSRLQLKIDLRRQ
jgi:hypothetical protein